ncbi:MAG: hypothetical protein ACRCSK_08575 [Fusobacteriaceae bacterium]
MLKQIFEILGKKNNNKIIALVFLSVIVSITEVFGLSILVPFMGIVTDFSLIEKNKYLFFIYNYFNFTEAKYFILYFGIAIITLLLVKTFIFILYNNFLVKFARQSYFEFSTKLMSNYLKWSYVNKSYKLYLSVFCF